MAITMRSLQVILLLVVLCLSNLVASADMIKYNGDNCTIVCEAPKEDALGVNLYRRRSYQRKILYYFFATDKLTVPDVYKSRVSIKNDKKTLSIEIFNLQLEDTGAYWCTHNVYGTENPVETGVFLLVQEPEILPASSKSPKSNGMNDLLIPVIALTAGSVLLLLLLVLVVWMVPKIKKLIRSTREGERRSNNEVYEVMTVHRRKEFT
ncbi:uncharacterized protein [Pseudorasbora parva]|uniref:uncharacterized protein isoform X1 n=1 Tax=Pseudorasbora parva TaxID=51549 RepID=UPI00351DE36B